MSVTIPPELAPFWRDILNRGLSQFQLDQVVGEEGEEILDALANLFSFLDFRDARRLDGGYFFEGDGVATATGVNGSIDLNVTPVGPVRILAGSPILQTSWGFVYLAARDLEVVGQSMTLDVVAAWAGYDGNTFQGLVDTFFIDADLAEPELSLSWGDEVSEADKTLVVNAMIDGTATIAPPFVGQQGAALGSSGPIDLLAESRGIFRVVNETDLGLALRSRQLNDAVTPGAIQRSCDEILALVGSHCHLVEWFNAITTGVSYTFDDDLLGAFDVSPIGQRRCFLVLVHDFPDPSPPLGGFAFGETEGGSFGVAAFGTTVSTKEGILDSVREMVASKRAFGYGGEVVVVDVDWVPTPGLTV